MSSLLERYFKYLLQAHGLSFCSLNDYLINKILNFSVVQFVNFLVIMLFVFCVRYMTIAKIIKIFL